MSAIADSTFAALNHTAAALELERAIRNRTNAQHSTGPVTAEGKTRSSQNSFKHGLTSLTFSLLPSEDAAAFTQLLDSLTAEYTPETDGENRLVLQVAQHAWLSQRAMNLQATAWNEDGTINDRRLSLALRHLNTHERLGRTCRAELHDLQAQRCRAETAEAKRQTPKASEDGFVLSTPFNLTRLNPNTASLTPTLRRPSSIPPKRKRIR